MDFKKDLQKIFKNQHGVALMMVMTAILLLMAIYGEFTFESKIARLKATNILDKSQSKLLAESGLQMAMTRLRLYKEAYNSVQANPNIKSMVQDQLLNQLWEVPFIFPIPIGVGANSSFKESVANFTKDSLLDGEMKVTIQNISNRLNLNMLRVDMTKFNPDQEDKGGQDMSSAINMSDGAIMNDVSIDQSLFFLLKKLVDDRKEKDEAFSDRYSNINYQEMLTNLKYYMSDMGGLSQDPLAGEADSSFQRIPLSPKFGPLGSSSELYVIPGWNDELIELIQNEFSVYPTAQIDFNKLTGNMLKILLPVLNDEDIKEFFIWRDDPLQPKFLNTKADFKAYVVGQERLISETDFENRIKLFEQKGISFGANPNLFKVVSEGTYNRSVYTLVAYVVLPKNEINLSKCPVGQTGTPPNCKPDSTSIRPPGTPPSTAPPAVTDKGAQLMEPKIIEIQIN
jgi:type II secretory pathway component PulK